MLFVNAPPESDEAAFLIMNEPIASGARIRELVKQGFLVRTRADADTREARSGETARREAAFASGAQVVSTDYYEPNPAFGTGYQVALTRRWRRALQPGTSRGGELPHRRVAAAGASVDVRREIGLDRGRVAARAAGGERRR